MEESKWLDLVGENVLPIFPLPHIVNMFFNDSNKTVQLNKTLKRETSSFMYTVASLCVLAWEKEANTCLSALNEVEKNMALNNRPVIPEYHEKLHGNWESGHETK